MNTMSQLCQSSVAFTYRSIDRLILNAYLPKLQTPAAMAFFLRNVQGKPILSGHVFKALTDRFVAQVKQFAQQQKVPVLRAQGRTKPGQIAQPLLRSAERTTRYGVVAIIVHQESGRVFCSTHAGGRATNFRVKEDRRLVNHYYFYLRDRRYGNGFVRISSYPPFQTRIWMNAHGYITARLRRRRIRFRADENCIVEVSNPDALQDVANQFDAKLAETVARQWLARIPNPLLPRERAAGYSTHLSVYQAEFCDNVIFQQARVLNRVYEQLLRDHLHFGRLDMVKIFFGRRIYRNTRSQFCTRVLRQGVVSCLKVFYRKSFLKEYNKGGRVLRTEVCVNDPTDFGVRKGLAHLDYLGTVAKHAITRFQKAQAVALSTALDRSTFERMITPSEQGGQRVPALRFGAPRVMRVLEGLGCAGLCFHAFSNAELRQVLVERLGACADEMTSNRLTYELRKLRGKGLVRKVAQRNRYTLTDLGYRVCAYFTKLHQRLLAPMLDRFDQACDAAMLKSSHSLDRAINRLNQDVDQLARLCALQPAT